jgi:LCP family protein required for cell wall assembly
MRMKLFSDYNNVEKRINLEKKHKGKKKKSLLFYMMVFFCLFCVGLVGFVLPVAGKFALLDAFLTLAPASNFISTTNIIILGVDSNEGTHRSDTIMIASINPLEREAKLVSIPRDTIVFIPGKGLDKINHAFVFGGLELSRVTASQFLDVPIPFYLTIDIGGLADIIDKLGGITIDVEKRMYYVDYAGDLFVNLKPGLQRLNGREAVGYVRFRHDNEGDIGRIQRQQKFMRALAAELTSRENFLRSPGLLISLLSDIHTNLNFKQIIGFAMAVRSAYDLGRISMTSIPGKDVMINKVSYWQADYKATREIVQDYLITRDEDDTEGTGRVAKTPPIF